MHTLRRYILFCSVDPKVLERTGKIITTASIGKEFGFKDIDGMYVIQKARPLSMSDRWNFLAVRFME